MTESPEGWLAGAYVNWFVDIRHIDTDVQELQYSSDMASWETLAAITLSNSTANVSSYRIPSTNTLYSTYYVNLPAGISSFYIASFLLLNIHPAGGIYYFCVIPHNAVGQGNISAIGKWIAIVPPVLLGEINFTIPQPEGNNLQ